MCVWRNYMRGRMMSQLFRLVFHFLVKEESGASVNDKVEQGENLKGKHINVNNILLFGIIYS